MDVYLIEHDDRMYDMGDAYIRGVYATKDLAEANIAAKATRDTEGHSDLCCTVSEWTVEGSVAAIFEPTAC